MIDSLLKVVIFDGGNCMIGHRKRLAELQRRSGTNSDSGSDPDSVDALMLEGCEKGKWVISRHSEGCMGLREL